MIDSGNLLKDPISNNDVIIVEKNSLIGIIDSDLLNHMDDILNGKWLDNGNIHNYKFKLIPFSSLGNENGIILGFKPEYIKIYDEEEKLRKEVIVGIYPGKLTKTNLYTSLIGLNILKEGI
jgi:stage II sporulation protein GA (sporulation sigma-E factor processing peptidase)